jgi:PKD domain-containing protein
LTTLGKCFISPAVAHLGAWPAVALALLLSLSFSFIAPAARADPVAQFSYSPSSPLTGETVTFTSTSTGVSAETWDLDGDRLCGDREGSTAQWAYAIPDVYKVTLCVGDGSGQSASQTLRITVRNRAPVASFTYAPATPLTGERIVLSSISADPDGPIVGQSWDLDGDGAFDDGTGPTAEWAFLSPGTHPVRLVVADRNGASSFAELPVVVHEPPPEPITPFPVVSMLAAVAKRGTTIEQLVVRAPAGAKIRVRCRGRSCPFRSFAMKAGVEAKASRIVRIRRFRRHLLRPGTVIEIRVTKRGEIGKFTRFLIRKGKPPKRTDRCLPPGANRPKRCS